MYPDLRKLIYRSIECERYDILKWCLKINKKINIKIIMLIVSTGKLHLIPLFGYIDDSLFDEIGRNLLSCYKYIRKAIKNNYIKKLNRYGT